MEKFYTNTFEDWVFTYDFTSELLLKHFETTSFKGFGIETLDQGIIAAGAVVTRDFVVENCLFAGVPAIWKKTYEGKHI